MRVVQLQFLVVTTDFDDEEMPKPAGTGPNDEEEVKEVVFPRYDYISKLRINFSTF